MARISSRRIPSLPCLRVRETPRQSSRFRAESSWRTASRTRALRDELESVTVMITWYLSVQTSRNRVNQQNKENKFEESPEFTGVIVKYSFCLNLYVIGNSEYPD